MSYRDRYPPNGGDSYRSSSYRDYHDDDYHDGRSQSSLPPRPSRPTGPPSSLPQRPPVNPRIFGESYRPLPPFPSQGDYRRSDRGSRAANPPPPPPPNYAPPPLPSDLPPPATRDTYRPPQGSFTFRADAPPGIQQSYTDGYRGPKHRRNQIGGPRHHWQQENGQRRPRHSWIPAERDLLKASYSTGTEQELFSTEGGVTYRPIIDLTDSDEAEMDISGDEADGPAEPSNKRARLSISQAASGDSVPKWSNSDPYSALPAEAGVQTKKKDVVQMIRKARVPAKDIKPSLPTSAEDFISFDLDESDDEVQEIRDVEFRKKSEARNDDDLNSRNSRKRTYGEYNQLPHASLEKSARAPAGGLILSKWREKEGENPYPWQVDDHSTTPKMGVWLHKDIVDFYEFVKPREFEGKLREALIQDLKQFSRAVFRKDAEFYPFGSYPSGLYLPTADMDLVFMSDSFRNSGVAKYDKKSVLFSLQQMLVKNGKAYEGNVEVISHAKVPIVKYVDQTTGLKVDISFENSTGITALETFKGWKNQYPAMPALVTLIKHFLAMRGLNEPVNGGIGGFSVTCLVVSMLQMMPQVQSRNMDPRHHLGELLLEFLDLYGNNFDYTNLAICLDPPKYIPKHKVSSVNYVNYDRLSIIDPNNPANDISGGSRNFYEIAAQFSRAHSLLIDRMEQLDGMSAEERQGQTILGVILGGNYSTFRWQRAHLERLSAQRDPFQYRFPAEQDAPSASASSKSKRRPRPPKQR
ncbi:hypothetical protein B0T26DRAFT_399226 [Lasiosphaeria miniovina]|uniref:polynucleotide adenylyltransferase n=1 Tax=Lasiosphaeria miniovina TaxID=1954250 RepID=A0AA40DMK3_9PEZI|nr:uncharacterized protein B0T26DRAFT_399226 [Lasiosphaeria miniovina]KAK0709219.1 hypothetical protein B0T26DRAFT_399226 [Lasiosphaeria miniovina]